MNGDVDGHGEGVCTHTFRDSQAWLEVDIGAIGVIESIKVWNRTDGPFDKGQPRDYFTRRLFPFWVIISTRPLPKLREDSLDAALNMAESARRFTLDTRCTEWACPAMTIGRYVRVQLEETNFLHIAQLEVFGNWGSVMRPISSVHCGRDVTATIVLPSAQDRDLEEAYLRAVSADPYNAILLRQYETFQPLYDEHGRGDKITGPCMLCKPGRKCELCYVKAKWKYCLESKGGETLGGNPTIREIARFLFHENVPPGRYDDEWAPPKRGCYVGMMNLVKWFKRKKHGGHPPTAKVILEKCARKDATCAHVLGRVYFGEPDCGRKWRRAQMPCWQAVGLRHQ